jgi:SRSO17 transposase
MATTPDGEPRSPLSACAGSRAWVPHLGLAAGHGACATRTVAAAADDHPSCFGATGSINRSWQRPSLSGLPTEAWHAITWREGSADWRASRFAQQRVRPAHRDAKLSEPRAEEWLLIEWPQNETEPTKYWFATLPECRS